MYGRRCPWGVPAHDPMSATTASSVVGRAAKDYLHQWAMEPHGAMAGVEADGMSVIIVFINESRGRIGSAGSEVLLFPWDTSQ